MALAIAELCICGEKEDLSKLGKGLSRYAVRDPDLVGGRRIFGSKFCLPYLDDGWLNHVKHLDGFEPGLDRHDY